MIAIISAAIVFLAVSGSVVLAQSGDEKHQSDTSIQPAAKSGVYKGLNNQLQKMQKTRADKNRLNANIERVEQSESGAKGKAPRRQR